MQQKQELVVYGSLLDLLCHCWSILTKRIASRTLAFGELLFRNSSSKPLCQHQQISWEKFWTVTLNYVALLPTVTFLRQQCRSLIWQHATSLTTLLLFLLGALKAALQLLGLQHILLHVSSLHQCHFRYKPELYHILGIANTMADDCNRLWHLNDSQLVSYFNTKYPQTNHGTCSSCGQRCTLCWFLAFSKDGHHWKKNKDRGTSGVRLHPHLCKPRCFECGQSCHAPPSLRIMLERWQNLA